MSDNTRKYNYDLLLNNVVIRDKIKVQMLFLVSSALSS